MRTDERHVSLSETAVRDGYSAHSPGSLTQAGDASRSVPPAPGSAVRYHLRAPLYPDSPPEAFRSPEKSGILLALETVPYTESPWRERYPELVERMREWGEPWRAINNRVERNICLDSPWEMNTDLYRFRDNWGTHPGQIPEEKLLNRPDEPQGDGFAMHPDSPARNRGFQPVLFAHIGPRCLKQLPGPGGRRNESP